MVNFNGTILEDSKVYIESNRGFLFGDSVFETVKVLDKKVLFLEDHYFRLMATMRIFRMEIPMSFTMEFVEEQILLLVESQMQSAMSYRVRFSVFREGTGFYLPKTNEVSYLITILPLESEIYYIKKGAYEVELYKDAYVTKQLFSSLKSNNKMIQITGSIFAAENGYDNCLLLNDEKNVIEALQGNLFMRMGTTLITPPVTEGCLNGIMRKQILTIAKRLEGYEVVEKSISPFDLQKADELFITNVIVGIQPITKYRKKEYQILLAEELLLKLNALIRLN
ncbi:MAG: aminotransferase class IV [Flavobacterium sp.]|uniref:aminotransferase class IV n=1 Tax=unclassified Flavobacterium TaxID=196869 RepID=UPI000C4E39D7|nr:MULTISPECIES: aminotransferase class IV [unclassified Flavobacterium]MBF01715.1 aminotransferase class IV [Flavobacterium sp.]MCO6162606.1 aminotransferase class IV [Flavobacterium sp. NRK F7]|tara:strand:- start:835 stop:1677 length:843 start_codon:yes stop_codon:yes gene_type:complete